MQYLSCSQIANITPGNPHPATITRWMRKGTKARNGQRVKLRHVRIGGRLYATEQWLDQFFVDLAEADAEYFDEPTGTPTTTKTRSETRRERDISAAAARLHRANI